MFNHKEDIISTNKAFSDFLKVHLNAEKPWLTRKLASLGGILFSMFFFMDYLSIENNLIPLLILRGFGLLIFIYIYFISYKKDFFQKFYNHLFVFSYLAVSTIIIIMLILSGSNSLAHDTYFAGLMIVIFSIFPFTYLSYRYLFTISLIIFIEYIMMFYFIASDRSFEAGLVTLNNILFMMGALTLGFISDLVRKNQLYFLFKTQHQLKLLLLQSEILQVSNIDTENDFISNITSTIEKSIYSRLAVCFIKLEGKDKDSIPKLKKLVALSINHTNCKQTVIDNTLLISYFLNEDDLPTIKSMSNQLKLSLDKDIKFYRSISFGDTNQKHVNVYLDELSIDYKVSNKKIPDNIISIS